MSLKLKSLDNDIVSFDRKKDPHGAVQWKGTDVCIDIHCACGESSHYDGDFMYFFKCPYCGRVYEVNGHVELIPIDIEREWGKLSEGEVNMNWSVTREGDRW